MHLEHHGGGGRGAAATPPPPDTARGAVFVYRRSATGKWSSAGTLDGSGARPGAQFGIALAVVGDLALVAAPADSAGGWVYSYRRAQNGEWALAGTLPAQGVVSASPCLPQN